jgi:hypothetical protein
MRYCYCPECDKLRPRNWYSRGKCEICGGRCVDIEVPRTIMGYLMYVLDVIAAIFIGIYLFTDSLTGGLGEFIDSLGVTGVVMIIFLLIGASLVFGYLDLKETTKLAEIKVQEFKERRMMTDEGLSPDLEADDEGSIQDR